MYEELVKRLWECASGECFNCSQYTETTNASVCSKELMKQAADAIEQLTADLERSKEWEAFWEEEANEALKKFQTTVASSPRWIPVTERLPELMHEYVLCCGAKGGQFVGWVATKTYDGGDKATAFVHGGHGRNITHWMPLPEPPKEE